jgi:hypothetical protein
MPWTCSAVTASLVVLPPVGSTISTRDSPTGRTVTSLVLLGSIRRFSDDASRAARSLPAPPLPPSGPPVGFSDSSCFWRLRARSSIS